MWQEKRRDTCKEVTEVVIISLYVSDKGGKGDKIDTKSWDKSL